VEEIFRFVNVRPVQRASEINVERRFVVYDKVEKSEFHREIEQLTGPDAREQAIELARKRLHTNNPDDDELSILIDAIRKGTSKNNVTEAKRTVERKLGKPILEYLRSEKAKRLKNFLWDQLYAHTLAPEEIPDSRESIYIGVVMFHFLEFILKQQDTDSPLKWFELLTVTPIVPKGVIPKAPTEDKTWELHYSEKVMKSLDTIYDKVVSLNSAIEELKNNDRIFKAQELRSLADLSAANIQRIQPLPTIQLTGPAVELPGQIQNPVDKQGSSVLEKKIEQKVIFVPKKTPWIFEEFGQKNITKPTLELLTARKNRLVELEVAETYTSLEQEKYELVMEFLKKLPMGGVHYIRNTNQFTYILNQVAIPGYLIDPIMPVVPLPEPGSATARGIQPLGIGDLLIIKQELMRYTAGEVAHIENVLKSEFKTRTDTRSREIEEVIITETEQLEETEKDLQTTERFELQKEAERTIQEQMSLQAGVSITAGYGPVSVTAHADFALSQSSTESNRTASTFARQVTERSLSRIMKRSREQRMRRTLERYEEKNEHGFDNKAGTGHVIGIYRWVDKYYKARLINYGRRMMLEFMIPEPAAFYLYLQSKQTPKGVTMKKPVEPMASGHKLRPDDLTKWNYVYYVAQYNVKDVQAYPPEVVYVSAAFAEASGAHDNTDYAKSNEKLVVPTGYKCYDVFGELGYQGIENSGFFIECFIAGQRWGSVTARGLEGIIPISVKGWITAFHVNVVAICELKPETKTAWQLSVYTAIMNAYEQALAEYNEQISAAQIQAGIEIQGRNPELNRKIEQDELKKGVLRLLTNNFAKTRVNGNWRFNEIFDATYDNGQFGYPEFHIDEAMIEGKIIQFFEQSFEWNNMTYRFLPYSWGRMDGWKNTFPITDIDPQFTDFLRAGEARVIIPVHPAYNETLLHYMSTNEIWNGGNPPTLDDPLFISIVEELKSDTGGDIDEEIPVCATDAGYPCLSDEWEIKLPTTLVYLQRDATLPDFTT
jgi:hypothetical protein